MFYESTNAGTLVAKTTKNPVGTTLSHHNVKRSPNNVDYQKKLHTNVQRKLGRQPNDDMLQIDVNIMIWVNIYVRDNKAAVHLGQNYQEKSAYHQEHGLPHDQTFVRYLAVNDLESKARTELPTIIEVLERQN